MLAQHCADLLCDDRWLGQPAGAKFTARHCALVRVHDVHTVAAQLCKIALGGWMVPHPHIHGGNRKNGLICRKQDRCRQIIRDASRHFCQNIGSRRANHDQVGLTAQLDMPDFAFFLQVEHVAIDLIFGHHCH